MSDATSMTDERLLELVRQADPLAGESPVTAWQTDAALTRLLAMMPEQAASAAPARFRLRPSRRLMLGGIAVLVAASVAIVLGLPGGNGGSGSGTPSAFAAWSPMPTAPASGQVAAAEAACGRVAPDPEEPAVAGRAPTVADTRGPFTMLVYVEGRSNQACVAGPSGLAGTTSDIEGEEVAAPDTILWRLAGGGSGIEDQPADFVDGQVGPGVTATTLVLEDGTKVQATIANGWFAAWWPGREHATSAEVTTANATTTEPLVQPQDSDQRGLKPPREHETEEQPITTDTEASGSDTSPAGDAPSTTETPAPAGTAAQ